MGVLTKEDVQSFLDMYFFSPGRETIEILF